MTSKLKIIIAVVIVLAIGAFIYYRTSIQPNQQTKNQPNVNTQTENNNSQQQSKQNIQADLPAATGKADDTVNALLKDSSDEDSQIKEEEGDTDLVTSDSQEISNLGQSYDEKEL